MSAASRRLWIDRTESGLMVAASVSAADLPLHRVGSRRRDHRRAPATKRSRLPASGRDPLGKLQPAVAARKSRAVSVAGRSGARRQLLPGLEEAAQDLDGLFRRLWAPWRCSRPPGDAKRSRRADRAGRRSARPQGPESLAKAATISWHRIDDRWACSMSLALEPGQMLPSEADCRPGRAGLLAGATRARDLGRSICGGGIEHGTMASWLGG